MSSPSTEFHSVLHHDDPVVRDHTVHGVHIMPGVTFVDVILRAFAATGLGHEQLELRKILFREPLVLAPGGARELRVRIDAGARAHAVVIESRPAGSAAGFECNVSGEAALAAPGPQPALDLERLRAGAERVLELDRIYAIARSMRIEHGPFMKTEGRVYVGPDYVLAHVERSALAAVHDGEFVLHPALLDAATLPYAACLFGDDTSAFQAPFIPIYVEAFHAAKPLEREMCVLVRAGHGTRALEDVLYNDIQVLDAGGAPLASFKRLGAKRIRSPELITRRVRALVGGDAALLRAAEPPEPPASATPPEPPASATPREPPASATPPDALPYAADGLARVRRALCRLVAELLPAVEARGGVAATQAELDTEAGFYDLGLQSTDLLALVQRLEQLIGQELYPTLLFEYSSIDKLAAYLEREHGAAWARTASDAEPVPCDAPAIDSRQHAEPPGSGAAITELLRPVWRSAPVAPEAPAGRALWVFVPRGARAAIDERLRAFALERIELGAADTEGASSPGAGDPDSELERALDAALERSPEPVGALFWGLEGHDEGASADALGVEQQTRELARIVAAQRCLRALATKPALGALPFLYLAAPGDERVSGHAIAGFLRCLALEQPERSARVLYVDEPEGADDRLAERVASELAASGETAIEVRCVGGRRERRGLEPVASAAPRAALRRGTVVVSGGAGGLGLLVAEHFASRQGAHVLLLGRRPLAGAAGERVARLQAAGHRVSYAVADVRDSALVQRALRAARQSQAPIVGVVHCAGVARDGLARAQRADDTGDVWATKLLGAAALDRATRHDALEFFVCFSSLSALSGNVGQSAYAGANAGLAAWTRARAAAVARGERSGRSVAIAWPLWAEGGMHPGRDVARALERSVGLFELGSAEGLELLERCLAGSEPELAAVKAVDDVHAALRTLAPLRPRRPAPDARLRSEARSPRAGADDAGDGAMAIIGISGRYPDARDLDAFWQNLCAGRDSIREIPATRWSVAEHFDPRRGVPGKSYARWGGFLDGIDEFDPLFFDISPAEAKAMDPQERLFLECAWATLEDAGYPRSLAPDARAARERRVGVFVGVMWHEYQLLALEASLRGEPVVVSASAASVANRVSYCLDLRGPSLPVDTMCSSSLMAIHLACESIRRGECSMALAGGVNLMLHPSKYEKLCHMQMLSSDGRCRSFGQGGDGYVPGEGVGCVLIKPLARALADGDCIRAVIRGTAVNHGGKTSGMTVPSPAAQAELTERALAAARVPAASISYVEAHGTGTALGDPIEIQGLARAFAHGGAPPARCAIGSVKSNIGHLEAAAGIAAVTKVVLQLWHGRLAPSLHAEQTNDKIDFSSTPFVVQRTLEPWQRPVVLGAEGPEEQPRRACVSSFGAGGVNVQVVLEEYRAPRSDERARALETAAASEPVVVRLSAKKAERLTAYARRLHDFVDARLQRGDAPALVDLAHTLRRGREPFRQRLAIVAASVAELVSSLRAFAAGEPLPPNVFVGDAKLGRARSSTGELVRGAASCASSTRAAPEARGAAWVLGADADGDGGEAEGCRIPLPTYPFAAERHWAVPAPREPAPTAADAADADTGDADAPTSPLDQARSGRAALAAPDGAALRVDTAELGRRRQIEQHLIAVLARAIDAREHDIEVDEPLERYGVDSVVAARLLSTIEDDYGPVPTALLLEHRTVAAIAAHLADAGRSARAAAAPAPESRPQPAALSARRSELEA